MNKASEWLNVVSVLSKACSGDDPQGARTERIIRRIQADALAAAAEICLVQAESLTHHDATDCARAILKEVEKLNL